MDGACQISGQILDRQGNVVRSLKPSGTKQAGTHTLAWDGLSDEGVRMPAGEYECRIVLNPTIYKTAGGIGNTSVPPNTNHNPSDILSAAADAEGHVYTANLWEEAAQDFRKWNRDDGQHAFNAKGSIRNGKPNALTYSITVDEKYIYCATYSHTTHAQQHIRRFRLADGEPAPFPAPPPMLGTSSFMIARRRRPQNRKSVTPRISGSSHFELLPSLGKNSSSPMPSAEESSPSTRKQVLFSDHLTSTFLTPWQSTPSGIYG